MKPATLRHPAWLAALAAAAAGLPALALPFLADDWLNLAAVVEGVFRRTAYGYFRPFYLGTYWLDWQLSGLSPAFFHLTNLLLICGAVALMVVLIERYTADASLAGLAGLLLALHPFHVHNAAWIA